MDNSNRQQKTTQLDTKLAPQIQVPLWTYYFSRVKNREAQLTLMPALASGGRVLSALFMFLLFLAHSVSSEGVAGPPLAQFVAVVKVKTLLVVVDVV